MDYYDMLHFTWRQHGMRRYGLEHNWVNKIFDMKWYHRMPPVTKVWFTLDFVLPLAAAIGILNGYNLTLIPGWEFQPWRPFT